MLGVTIFSEQSHFKVRRFRAEHHLDGAALLLVFPHRHADTRLLQVAHPSSLKSDVIKTFGANICSYYLQFISMYEFMYCGKVLWLTSVAG
jgi:hypothetical protein